MSMKNSRTPRLLLTVTLILAPVSSGCVSTTLQLSSDHPARIDAPSGRVESEPAAILRPNAPLYASGEHATATEPENRGSAQAALSSTDAPEPDGTREAP